MKITLIQVQTDADGAAEVFRMAGLLLTQPVAAQAAMPALSPAPEEPARMKRLPAPKMARKEKPAPAHAAEERLPMTQFLLREISTRPKTLDGCVKALIEAGYEATSKSTYGMLGYLRSRNLVYREDDDGTWRKAL